jgi:NitT/TauT family transport system substrate-binding protein
MHTSKSWIVAGLVSLAFVSRVHAEAKTVTIVQQIGLTSLSIMVMESEKLVEKHAAENGLSDLTVRYVSVSGAAQIADVLLSRTADVVLMGFPTAATIWTKTAGTQNEIKSISATLNMPFMLTTRNPNVHSLADFTSKDRIAVPAIKISTMALLLQMGVAKELGMANFNKLDPLTVQMSHPSAVISLLTDNGPVDAHVATAPFYQQELANPAIHLVMKSYDVTGGPHNNGMLGVTRTFYQDNPKIIAAILAAQEQADALIKQDPARVADIYLRMANDKKDKQEDIIKLVTDPDIEFTTVPTKMQQLADFMYDTGSISKKLPSWKDLYFESAHSLPGN